MSRSLTSRLAAQPILRASCAPAIRCPFQASRSFSQTSASRADDKPKQPSGQKSDGTSSLLDSIRSKAKPQARPNSASLLENIYGAAPASDSTAKPNAMANLSQSLVFQTLNQSNIDISGLSSPGGRSVKAREDSIEPFHFHIFTHKHNTHITCTKPNRDPIISMSCGNIGFRKSRRGTFDAAYSLTKYVLERLIHNGWPMKMNRLEVVTRGFGQGREAALKVLMSPEGKVLQDKIVRVADSTRIKFGGTRSKKPRRL